MNSTSKAAIEIQLAHRSMSIALVFLHQQSSGRVRRLSGRSARRAGERLVRYRGAGRFRPFDGTPLPGLANQRRNVGMGKGDSPWVSSRPTVTASAQVEGS